MFVCLTYSLKQDIDLLGYMDVFILFKLKRIQYNTLINTYLPSNFIQIIRPLKLTLSIISLYLINLVTKSNDNEATTLPYNRDDKLYQVVINVRANFIIEGAIKN